MKLFMSFIIVVGLVFILLTPQMKADSSGNAYPIVLVHGLGGWGSEEISGFNYWGGLNNIQSHLNKKGFETHVPAVGPVSSNWDRAAELYAYIKGGTVDYGAEAHSNQHGHDRYGDTFPGVINDWNSTNKIHLLGHSMGGQSSRQLVEFLKSGSEVEKTYHENHPEEEAMSSLFEGGKDWVHSVTTLATPHNGSAISNESEDFLPLIKSLIWKYLSLMETHTGNSFNYDFDLDHWGLKRQSDESLHSYIDRLFNNAFWETNDTSQFDLSLEGANEFNNQVKTYEDIYYFSYTGDATYKSVINQYRLPLLSMNPLFYTTSFYLGRYDDIFYGIDSSWYPNDGLVSVPSSQYPIGHSAKAVTSQQFEKGVWNYNPTQYRWDHTDFIGIDISDTLGFSDIKGYYKDIAENLASLPE
ncbi:lipase [Bacillus carboniphilus]|uniref:triacylglycerol lipase n=1 Tax=Bacillus carboniphilus TaxID=86663 RepID=A0ABY9JP88_9BACI|nr:lipase [Bacillus carboniphilus]WLR41230.1 lipase [Bacillus carboniphilus]